jgi:hypothetical protein
LFKYPAEIFRPFGEPRHLIPRRGFEHTKIHATELLTLRPIS